VLCQRSPKKVFGEIKKPNFNKLFLSFVHIYLNDLSKVAAAVFFPLCSIFFTAITFFAAIAV
jgi:hypothetical protein